LTLRNENGLVAGQFRSSTVFSVSLFLLNYMLGEDLKRSKNEWNNIFFFFFFF
jgi:hypothetical protein